MWILLIQYLFLIVNIHGRVYERCELAQELKYRHKLSNDQIGKLVCIAERHANLDTSAVSYYGDGSGTHGLFKLSDNFWCSPPGKGEACGVSCSDLRDDDITDDLYCVSIIMEEHERLSGDGFNAWDAYQSECKYSYEDYIEGCFNENNQIVNTNFLRSDAPISRGRDYKTISRKGKHKIYDRCELAEELLNKHDVPMDQIATWVCIAKYESNYNTSAIGYGDHGLFQISDIYWCSPPGKGWACGLSCADLENADITDDVECIKRIYEEHQRLSGDGFNAWTVYKPRCKGKADSFIKGCSLNQIDTRPAFIPRPGIVQPSRIAPPKTITSAAKKVSKYPGKIYGRCELALELRDRYGFPEEQIATWVCIVKHESNYNTSAIGRLNSDGSEDHGLFQISDIYWCSPPGNGWVCGLSCAQLEDDDISDDVECMRKIYDEHEILSGDGFNAWSVYQPYCRGRSVQYVEGCFDDDNLIQTTTRRPTTTSRTTPRTTSTRRPTTATTRTTTRTTKIASSPPRASSSTTSPTRRTTTRTRTSFDPSTIKPDSQGSTTHKNLYYHQFVTTVKPYVNTNYLTTTTTRRPTATGTITTRKITKSPYDFSSINQYKTSTSNPSSYNNNNYTYNNIFTTTPKYSYETKRSPTSGSGDAAKNKNSYYSTTTGKPFYETVRSKTPTKASSSFSAYDKTTKFNIFELYFNNFRTPKPTTLKPYVRPFSFQSAKFVAASTVTQIATPKATATTTTTTSRPPLFYGASSTSRPFNYGISNINFNNNNLIYNQSQKSSTTKRPIEKTVTTTAKATLSSYNKSHLSSTAASSSAGAGSTSSSSYLIKQNSFNNYPSFISAAIASPFAASPSVVDNRNLGFPTIKPFDINYIKSLTTPKSKAFNYNSQTSLSYGNAMTSNANKIYKSDSLINVSANGGYNNNKIEQLSHNRRSSGRSGDDDDAVSATSDEVITLIRAPGTRPPANSHTSGSRDINNPKQGSQLFDHVFDRFKHSSSR